MVEIITRVQWGARHDDGTYDRPVGSLDKWLHHTAMKAPGAMATWEQDTAAVRAIESVGESRFGRGISYTFVIPKSGRCFEGHSIGRIGSHTSKRNTGSAGIVLHGNYQNEPPTVQQEQTLAELLNLGVARGWWQLNTLTGGHRDVVGTACPGDQAYARIGHINWLADHLLHPTPVVNPVTPAPADNGSRPAPAFPLPSGWYFGPKSGPRHSVSGFYSYRAELRSWQQRMKDRGWYIDVDGLYGPNTAEVTALFQAEKGLVVDSLIGPQTWAAAWTAPIT